MESRDRIAERGSAAKARWLWIASACSGMGAIALWVASLFPLSSCGGKCKYCLPKPSVVDCTTQSDSSCPSSAECAVKDGCLCSAVGRASGVCTNNSCGASNTQARCEEDNGCFWTVGCFRDVDCLGVTLAECDSHPSCQIREVGCP